MERLTRIPSLNNSKLCFVALLALLIIVALHHMCFSPVACSMKLWVVLDDFLERMSTTRKTLFIYIFVILSKNRKYYYSNFLLVNNWDSWKIGSAKWIVSIIISKKSTFGLSKNNMNCTIESISKEVSWQLYQEWEVLRMVIHKSKNEAINIKRA